MITVPMTVASSSTSIPVAVGGVSASLQLGIGAAYSVNFDAHYEGAYEFTPSAETQVIQTEGLVMDHDVTINPIPSNYGLITYNGSSIRVS